MSIWLPGFDRVDLGPDGGPYDRDSNPKLVWHTWEGYSWAGAESAFAQYPPHMAVNPHDRQRRQYVSLDRHAYSLAGSDTEDSWVIQIEVAGYAGETHDWPAAEIEWLGRDVLAPILEYVPVPPILAPQGFHGEGEGIILASAGSPVRFDLAGWDGFAGHVGHQHAPAPDSHWDPGRLDVAAIIAAATGSPATEPPEEEELKYYLVAHPGTHEWFVTDLATFKTYIYLSAIALEMAQFGWVHAAADGGPFNVNWYWADYLDTLPRTELPEDLTAAAAVSTPTSTVDPSRRRPLTGPDWQ